MELNIPVEGGHLWADDSGGDGPTVVLLHPGWGLGLRTWAPADPGRPARDQVRGAVDAFFATADFERPDPPAYAGLAEITAPSAVVTGDLEYPMVARCAAEVAARIPGCRQIAAPGGDHLLPLRVPDLIAGLTEELAG